MLINRTSMSFRSSALKCVLETTNLLRWKIWRKGRVPSNALRRRCRRISLVQQQHRHIYNITERSRIHSALLISAANSSPRFFSSQSSGDALSSPNSAGTSSVCESNPLRAYRDIEIDGIDILNQSTTTVSSVPIELPPPGFAIGSVQTAIVGLHTALHLPWWQTIVCGALMLRVSLSPLVVYSLYMGRRSLYAQPELSRLNEATTKKLRQLNDLQRDVVVRLQQQRKKNDSNSNSNSGGGGGDSGGSGGGDSSNGVGGGSDSINRGVSGGGSSSNIGSGNSRHNQSIDDGSSRIDARGDLNVLLNGVQRDIGSERWQTLSRYFTALRLIWSKHNCHPARGFLAPMVQIPSVLLFVFSVRDLIRRSDIDHAGGVSALGAGLTSGGPDWLISVDLTSPDPSMFLPVLAVTLTYTLIQMQFGSKAKRSSIDGNDSNDTSDVGSNIISYLKDGMQVCLIMGLPLIASLPQGIFFYWIPSTIYGVCQTILLRQRVVREFIVGPDPGREEIMRVVKERS